MLIATQIDIVVVVLDKVRKSLTFAHLWACFSRPFDIIWIFSRVGKPHINIRWSDDGSDENERIYRYRLNCGRIVSARGTPHNPRATPRAFSQKKWTFDGLRFDHHAETTAGTLRGYLSIQ